jgi:hypothetical protein
MWNMKCFVIPVIIGATGIVSKSLQKYLETIPEQHSIDGMAEGPSVNALLTMKVENCLTCLINTRIPTVSRMDWQFILPFETLRRQKASRDRRLE